MNNYLTNKYGMHMFKFNRKSVSAAMYARVLCTLILFLTATSLVNAQEDNVVKVVSLGTAGDAQPGKTVEVSMRLEIDDEWHINSDRPNDDFLIASALKISGPAAKNFAIQSVRFPKAKTINFDFSDKPVSVFEGQIDITARLQVLPNAAAGKQNVEFLFTYQACNNTTCQAPSSLKKAIQIQISGKPEISETISQSDSAGSTKVSEITKGEAMASAGNAAVNQDEAARSGNEFESKGLLLSIIIVFLGGLALNLTPCVYPLIPITVGYFGGQSEGRTSRLFLLGVLYVLGMAITYSVIGVVTAMSGAVFGALLQNTFVILGIVAVLVALSLSMFGLYEFKLPDALVEKAGGARSGVMGAFFMGLTMGIVAAPCIGPFVLGLVTYVGAKADPVLGFTLFFSLALGLGLPYLLLALFSGKIKKLPRAGFWMEAVKHVFGFILLGMALYFLLPLIPKSINGYVLPVYMVLAALYLLFIDKKGDEIKGFRYFKSAFSVLIIIVSVYMLLPGKPEVHKWEYYTGNTSVVQSGRPAIIDFYADWCLPCKELDAITFKDNEVLKELSRFRTVKVDMTRSDNEANTQLSKKYGVKGMPTVIIMDSAGREISRITGFVKPEKFVELVKKVN